MKAFNSNSYKEGNAMSRGKIINQSFGYILFWTVCVLLSLAIFTIGSFSYARYISSNDENSSAGVANMGIEVFELEKGGSLVTNIDYTQVVPGADIPGPHIKLKMCSEVSWSLYVKVTEYGFPVADGEGGDNSLDEKNGNAIAANVTVGKDENGEDKKEWHNVVMYEMSDEWELVDTQTVTENDEEYYVKTYKYTFKDTKTGVFKPATQYDYTGSDEIELLMGDVIFISQYYGDYFYGDYKDSEVEDGDSEYLPPHYRQDIKFGLSFETYIRQVLG